MFKEDVVIEFLGMFNVFVELDVVCCDEFECVVCSCFCEGILYDCGIGVLVGFFDCVLY